jgi:flagellar basal body-associated protein FliL
MGLMGILKVQFNAGLGTVTIFSLIILLLMLVVEGVFISLLFGSKSDSNDGKSAMELLKKQTTRELEAAQPHALSEPMASVTEHTTRAFEPIYVQKKAE